MEEITWKKKENNEELSMRVVHEVPFLSFPVLERSGLVSHGFSTRLGGVSKGDFATMNFSFTRGDNRDDVLENYRRMAEALEVDSNSMVLSFQTHTTNVRAVTAEDMGKGVTVERDYRDVDGLITNVPGITLVTFYADCVPLYILDPVKKAIGLSHSGWRGTVNRMGKKTIDEMSRHYGSKPSDLIVCIGPSICKDCYEVSNDVAMEFKASFTSSQCQQILEQKNEEKYQLDLWMANRLIFEDAGIKTENISVTNTCTYCNPQLLFSHRRTGDKRGNLSAFLSLKKF